MTILQQYIFFTLKYQLQFDLKVHLISFWKWHQLALSDKVSSDFHPLLYSAVSHISEDKISSQSGHHGQGS